MSLVRKRIVLPLIPTDIFQVIRPTQNKDAVLDLTYQQLLTALSEVFSGGGSLILLQTDGVDNGDQNLLNLVAGSGITLSDDGLGAVTITSSGGSSFITSVADTASIDLTVTSGILTGNLVDIVAAGTFGSGTQVPQITIDTKGRVTSVSLVNITAGSGTVTSVGTGTGLTGGTITGAGTVSLNSKLAPADSLTGNALKYLRVNAGETAVEYATASSSGGILHGTTSGTDTYTTTITGATAYADGDAYLIRFAIGNTTSATLNINSQGAIPLYRNNDGPLLGGDVIAGGEMVCVYNSTLNIFQCIGVSPNSLIAYVTNDDSVTITKGQPVYAFSGTGDRMTVKLAYNTGDSTSAQTVGLVLSTSIAANQKGLIMMQGLLDGLSNVKPVNGWADGSPVYLGTTAGNITPTKQYAPNHLVYLGFVTTASPGAAGRVYVRVQNGYELDELHNVQAQTPANNDTLYYDNTVTPKQWKTTSVNTLLNPSIKAGSCSVVFDGAGGVITSGTTAYAQVPYNGTIESWTIVSSVSGSCTVTVFKDTYANFPPIISTDNVFTVQPALATQVKNQNLSPTFVGSQATVTTGDWIGFTISGITTATWVNLTLSITKTA